MVTRHYDSYTYANTSGSSQCVTVSVTNNCGDNALLSATYLDSFDPNNVCTNYLADMGASGPTFSYSFSVPVGATYIVTVLENSANVGCAAYSLTVNPCTIPTPTGTPPTATITRTATPTPSRTGTATATPCGLTTLFNETFESGTLGLFTATTITGTMPWAADNTVHHTGLWSAHVVDPGEVSDQRLSMTNAVAIPTVASSAQMQFFHRYGFEDDTVPYDGGVLEYSTDGGSTWTDAGALIIEGGYTGVLLAGGGNPLELRQAWTNRSPGYPAFTRVTVNLNTLRGQNVQFRFREGSDSGTGSDGWWVDDVTINAVLACVTGTITVGPTATRTGTTVPTVTGTPPTATRTSTVAPTVTGTPPTATQTTTPGAATSTPTVCPVQFSDVDQTNPFYVYVHCLACRGIISGYGDGTFRPYATVTRGQVAKIVANSAAINDPIPSNQQTFNDVPSSNAFWVYIERLAARGIISGYADGTFRPFNPVTRGQLAKIDVNAAGYNDPISGQTFADVSPSDPFYIFVERAALHGVISGYGCNNVSINPCTGQVEVCDAQNRPYFRTCATATRGQTAKIVANTFYPNCVVRTTGGKP